MWISALVCFSVLYFTFIRSYLLKNFNSLYKIAIYASVENGRVEITDLKITNFNRLTNKKERKAWAALRVQKHVSRSMIVLMSRYCCVIKAASWFTVDITTTTHYVPLVLNSLSMWLNPIPATGRGWNYPQCGFCRKSPSKQWNETAILVTL